MSTQQATPGPADLVWFKSSYSGSNGGECVEVAAAPGTIHVRDSKDASSPSLNVSTGSWSRFVAFVAKGHSV